MWPAVALKEVGGRAGKEQNGMGVSGRCKWSGMREEKRKGRGGRGEGGDLGRRKSLVAAWAGGRGGRRSRGGVVGLGLVVVGGGGGGVLGLLEEGVVGEEQA